MKYLPFVFLVFYLISCNQQQESERIVLQNQIDSLRSRLDSSYTPGLGEFMLSIQEHHAKLWFAGKNGNWDLANFEIDEFGKPSEILINIALTGQKSAPCL